MRNKKNAYSAVHVWVKCMVEYAVFCITDYSYLKMNHIFSMKPEQQMILFITFVVK